MSRIEEVILKDDEIQIHDSLGRFCILNDGGA